METKVEQPPSLKKRIRRFLKSVDRYGVHVGLTYKNQNCIKSVLGGISTIIARLIILSYLLNKCRNVFDQEYTL